MKIPLANLPQQLETGNLTYRTPNLRYEGQEAIAKGVETFGLNIAGLLKKKDDADNLRILIDQDLDLDNERLNFEKWKNDPRNVNNENSWEEYASQLAAKKRDQYKGMSMSNDIRLRVDDRLNKWENNLRVDAYSSSFKRSSEKLKNSFQMLQDRYVSTRDPNILNSLNTGIGDAEGSGIIPKDQADLMRESVSMTQRKVQLDDLNNNIQGLLDSSNFVGVRMTVEDAREKNLITESEYKAQMSRLDNKIIYADKLEGVGIEAEENPSEVLKKINNNSDRSSTSSAANVPPITGPTTVFGLDVDGNIDTQDNGVGAWGADTRDPSLMGVSLPFKTLERWYGKDYNEFIKNNKPMIEVTNPKTGKTILAPIVDAGPAEWTGHELDLTFAAARELGSTGKDTMTFRPANIVKGEMGWLSPNDREKVKQRAEYVLGQKAAKQFATWKEAIDIGQINPFVKYDDKGNPLMTGTNAVEDALNSNPQFKELANSPLKNAALDYVNKTPGNYEEVISEISSYDDTKDASGFRKVQLQAKIDAGFTGAAQTELNSRLKDQVESGEVKKRSALMSPLLSNLNKVAWKDQGLGAYKKQTMVELDNQADRAISKRDIEAGTLLFLDGVRRVPTTEDLGKKTGTKRWVLAVNTPDIEYVNDEGTIVKVQNKDGKKVANAKPVFEEDPDARQLVTERVATIRETLESLIKSKPSISREELFTEYRKLVGKQINLPVDVQDRSALSSPSAVSDKRKMMEEAAKNAAKQVR